MVESPHNCIIERLNGTRYNLEEIDIFVSSLSIPSPSFRHNREEVTGRHGFLDFGTDYEGRSLTLGLTLLPHDSEDFDLIRHELFRVFNSLESFYLIPQHTYTGQRFKVKVDSSYSVDRVAWDMGEVEIELISDSPFSESIGTSLNPVDTETEVWAFGQGLDIEERSYTHTTNTFEILNPSDTPINPRYLPLKITFTGASTNLKITNDTTGDVWQYLGTSSAGQVIILEGIRSTKGGLSIFGNTNRKLISLAEGINNFTITGATNPFSISFDFRIYKL